MKKMCTNTKKEEEIPEKTRQIIQQWFTTRSLSKSTQKIYLLYIKQFTHYTHKHLHQIHKQALKEQEKNIPLSQRTLTQQILNYKYHLDNTNYTQSTKYLKIKVIISYCNAFDIQTPEIRIKRPICETKNYERPIKKEELLLLLNTSPLREKAFLSLQATTGMGSKEIRTLTINQLITIINNECDTNHQTINEILQDTENILKHKIYEIRLIRHKVNYRYITYTTQEAMKNILLYLKYRQTHKKQELHIKPQDYNTPIFVTNKGKALGQKAVTAMYRVMGERVGFKNTPNSYRFWRSHNIRKYFYNIVEDCVGSEYADEWLGHVPSHTTQAYARREYRMRKAYITCLPYLTLTQTTDPQTIVKQKITLLEHEIEKLKQSNY